MRQALNVLDIEGTVVIGEGERYEAPMLYIGERVGWKGPKVDIALYSSRAPTATTATWWRDAIACSAMVVRASTRPTSTWTRSRSAAVCPTA